jgi:hypothetical protein
MITRMMLVVVELLRCFLACNNMYMLDVILQEWDVVLRFFKMWKMCYGHDDHDDVRFVARVGCCSGGQV